ncbi:MAG: glutathione S-transferase family protein [Alphaproteobacteria bacterium]|nr:glutathione S-transferase family protein [Alphaproteobacteria bacterium]
MVLLIHHSTSPQSRKARLIMAEKKMLFVLQEEEPWNLSEKAKQINPAQDLPILVFDGNVISGNYAITEYLEESNPQYKLLPEAPKDRAEVRRIMDWFDIKFHNEVYKYIVAEKIIKRFHLKEAPNSRILKAGLNNLKYHMEYVEYLTDRYKYIVGNDLTLADFTVAAHLSILDYLGDIPWDEYKNAKLWYAKIKSRPSFRDILKDTIRGIPPSSNYTNLDF